MPREFVRGQSGTTLKQMLVGSTAILLLSASLAQAHQGPTSGAATADQASSVIERVEALRSKIHDQAAPRSGVEDDQGEETLAWTNFYNWYNV